MTVILSYHYKDMVLLVGDLLLSSDLKRETDLHISTRFSHNQPAIPDYLVGLNQKVTCINDNLSVAWAGSKIVAQHLIRRIKEELTPPYSGQEILSLIANSELSENELNSVSFIFYGVFFDEKANKADTFVQDYLVGETIINSDSKVKYWGSGHYHFLENLDFQMGSSYGSANEYELATAWIIARVACALYAELVSEDLHNFAYGGGFEIAYLNIQKRKIEKLPLTFAFWRVQDSDIELTGPILAFNYPEDDKLLITRLHQDNLSNSWKRSQFLVTDIISQPQAINTAPPNFDTFFTVHYFLDDKSDRVKIMIKKGDEKSIRINNLEDSSSFEIDFSDKFLHEIQSIFFSKEKD